MVRSNRYAPSRSNGCDIRTDQTAEIERCMTCMESIELAVGVKDRSSWISSKGSIELVARVWDRSSCQADRSNLLFVHRLDRTVMLFDRAPSRSILPSFACCQSV
ncbi:unnamed protein product [Microthlaspi erraticum]|uniref:Uncharacterized protein n=1 Tax=Microthlaspi erraticum TaxID=1685480 RepID=A0A6D2KEV9_9BRAS|nr:unnamed protein product [Microthlaspi erraticum]